MKPLVEKLQIYLEQIARAQDLQAAQTDANIALTLISKHGGK